MKKIKSIRVLAALALLQCHTADGAQYWTRYFPDSTPFGSQITSMAELRGELVVFGNVTFNGTLGWTSPDGLAWTSLPLPALLKFPQVAASHGGNLYVCDPFVPAGPGVHMRIFRLNGTTRVWDTVYSEDHPEALGGLYSWGNPQFSSALNVGDTLYITRTDGFLISITGDGNPSDIHVSQMIGVEPNPVAPDFRSRRRIDLFLYGGKLHIASVVQEAMVFSSVPYAITFYRQTSGAQFESIGRIDISSSFASILTPVVKVLKNRVYVGFGRIQTASLDSTPLQWTDVPTSGGFVVPSVIFDRLFLFSSTAPVRMLNEDGSWIEAWNDRAFSSNVVPPVTVGNTAFIVSNSLISLRYGVLSLTYQGAPKSALVPGARSIPVLGFKAKASIAERMSLVVRNLGTADAAAIENVRLLRDRVGAQTGIQEAGIFEWEGATTPTWRLSNPIDVADGDIFYVAVDLAENAREGETCIFAIDQSDARFENNPGFVLPSPIVAPHAMSIQSGPSAAPELGSSIVVFPSPARDTVRFMYDLAETSDITIKIYNEAAVLVSEISDVGKPQGTRQETLWDASAKAPGVYWAVIKIKGAAENRSYKRKVYIKR